MRDSASERPGEVGGAHSGRDDFEARILAMLEGAALALLRTHIEEREEAAHAAALQQVQRERDEVAKLRAQLEEAHKAAELQLKGMKEYRARVRRRVRRAMQAAEVYRKTAEEIHERLEELVSSSDAYGISTELEAVLDLIKKASRMDPDFQSDG